VGSWQGSHVPSQSSCSCFVSPGSKGAGSLQPALCTPCQGGRAAAREGWMRPAAQGWAAADLRAVGLAVRERLLPHVLPSPPTRLTAGKCVRAAVSAVLRGPGQAAQLGCCIFPDRIYVPHSLQRKATGGLQGRQSVPHAVPQGAGCWTQGAGGTQQRHPAGHLLAWGASRLISISGLRSGDLRSSQLFGS